MKSLLAGVSALAFSFVGVTAPARLSAQSASDSAVERGRYLVAIMGCHDCHSPKIPGTMKPDPERMLSGRPVMVERAAYPDQVGTLVAEMDLAVDSITERLEALGVVFTDAEHVIDAVPASAEDARLLGVRAGVPLLRERRFTTDPSGQPVEWSDDRYVGSLAAFSIRNSVAVNALSRTSGAPS